jgi:uncharacterized protein (TIGR02145 family)
MRTNSNNQSYKVKKMADGHIWMVQDMKFGACSATGTWYNDNSAAATTHTPTVASGYVGHCTAATNSDTTPKRGYLYNWPAAINNSNAYYGSSVSSFQCTGTASGNSGTNPGACRGICPEGWHIPTGDTTGEFQALHTAIGDCSRSNDDCWNAASAFEGVLGGDCGDDGLVAEQNSIGHYWSSTYCDDSYAYALGFHSTTAYPGIGKGSKYVGRSVRCVRNY